MLFDRDWTSINPVTDIPSDNHTQAATAANQSLDRHSKISKPKLHKPKSVHSPNKHLNTA